jgi:hypothetical protein
MQAYRIAMHAIQAAQDQYFSLARLPRVTDLHTNTAEICKSLDAMLTINKPFSVITGTDLEVRFLKATNSLIDNFWPSNVALFTSAEGHH